MTPPEKPTKSPHDALVTERIESVVRLDPDAADHTARVLYMLLASKDDRDVLAVYHRFIVGDPGRGQIADASNALFAVSSDTDAIVCPTLEGGPNDH